MKTQQRRLYADLEFIAPARSHPQGGRWRGWLQACSQRWWRWFSGRREPVIQVLPLASGRQVWRVYNPLTRQFLFFNTEAEVRAWLERSGCGSQTSHSPIQ